VADNLAKYTVYLGNRTPLEDRLNGNIAAIYKESGQDLRTSVGFSKNCTRGPAVSARTRAETGVTSVPE
jgi:hypothetical protein